MKRLFFFGIVAFAVLALAYLRFGPLEPVRALSAYLPFEVASAIRPEIMPVVSISAPPPPARQLTYPRPLWEQDSSRHAVLELVAELKANDAGRHQVNSNRLNHLATGGDFIAAVDLASRHVVIFTPDLKIQRKWPMTAGLATSMQAPLTLAARNDEVAAIDKDGTLAWWDRHGKRQGSFSLDGVFYDLALLGNGDFLVHQTRPFPYTLAIYGRDGRKKKQFGALTSDEPKAAPLLHQGFIATGRAGKAALALINPYKIFFFSRQGTSVQAVEITPEFQVFEPFAEQLGENRWRVLRQRVVYDVAWHRDLLHVLVSSDPERAASWLEIFSPEGEFLQRFYLTMRAIQLTFWNDDLILLGYDPRLKLQRFRIEKIHRQRE